MDNMELDLSDDPASQDTFTKEVLKSMTSKAFSN